MKAIAIPVETGTDGAKVGMCRFMGSLAEQSSCAVRQLSTRGGEEFPDQPPQ
jgi:hypothetical protein